MSTVLDNTLTVFFFLVAPALLLVRFTRPRLLPRPALLALAALLGGAAFYARELVQQAAMNEWVRRAGLFEPAPPVYGEGMVLLQGPRTVDFVLCASLELVYLLLWLVPYGIIQIVRSRRREKLLDLGNAPDRPAGPINPCNPLFAPSRHSGWLELCSSCC